jgi:hypothetical protein
MRVIRYTPAQQEATLASDAEENAIEEIRQRRFLKAMALKESLGLTKEERHELAQLLPGVDKDSGGSWKELNPKQLHDLITMMEGFIFLSHIYQNRLDLAAENE